MIILISFFENRNEISLDCRSQDFYVMRKHSFYFFVGCDVWFVCVVCLLCMFDLFMFDVWLLCLFLIKSFVLYLLSIEENIV